MRAISTKRRAPNSPKRLTWNCARFVASSRYAADIRPPSHPAIVYLFGCHPVSERRLGAAATASLADLRAAPPARVESFSRVRQHGRRRCCFLFFFFRVVFRALVFQA